MGLISFEDAKKLEAGDKVVVTEHGCLDSEVLNRVAIVEFIQIGKYDVRMHLHIGEFRFTTNNNQCSMFVEDPTPITTLDDMLEEVRKIGIKATIESDDSGSEHQFNFSYGVCFVLCHGEYDLYLDKDKWVLEGDVNIKNKDPQKILAVLRAMKECE